MPRLSFSEMTTYRWTFEEDVLHYQAAGIAAIGVWRQKLSDYGEEKGIELLTESGLAVSNLQWAGGFTGSDGRSYKDCLEDAQEALHLAAAMQAPHRQTPIRSLCSSRQLTASATTSERVTLVLQKR